MLQSLKDALDASIVSAETLAVEAEGAANASIGDAQRKAMFKLVRHVRESLRNQATVAREAADFIAEYGHTDVELDDSIDRANDMLVLLWNASSAVAEAADPRNA